MKKGLGIFLSVVALASIIGLISLKHVKASSTRDNATLIIKLNKLSGPDTKVKAVRDPSLSDSTVAPDWAPIDNYDAVNNYDLTYDASKKEYRTTIYLEPTHGDTSARGVCHNYSPNVNNFNITVSGGAVGQKNNINMGCDVNILESNSPRDNEKTYTVDVDSRTDAQDKGAIRVRILYPDNKPVAQGYQIVYVQRGFVTKAHISDPIIIGGNGTATITGLPPGDHYALTNWSDSYGRDGALGAFCVPNTPVCYKFVKKDIKVVANQTTDVTITLTAVGQTEEDNNSCESHDGGFGLGWIMCPIIHMLDGATNWLDTNIQALLTAPDPQNIKNDNNDGNPLKDTWGRLRNIALIILVPIMLIMVISTALNFSFVDAYTVKRAMPRFLLAVLFISLSWYITAFLVNITNVVGRGILGLVTQPFGGPGTTLASLVNVYAAGATTYVGVGIFAAMVIAGAVSIGIVLSFAVVAVVALMIGFVILTFRQLLILVLLLLAPLAILSWIFPSNDKLWKLWWSSFTKLLLMFPLVMLLIGAGKDFAYILARTNIADNYSNVSKYVIQLMIVIAYIAPYFFLPATFKFAGGIFGNIAGMVNDRGRGLFDRAKKYRQTERAAGLKRFTTESGRGRLRQTGFVRRLGAGVGVGYANHFGFGARGRGARDTLAQTAAAEEAKDPRLEALGLSDEHGTAVLGLSGGTEAGAEQASRELYDGWLQNDEDYQTAVAHGDVATQRTIEQRMEARRVAALGAARAAGITKARARAGFRMMMNNKARSVGSVGGQRLLQRGADRLAGQNTAEREHLMGEMQFAARAGGRTDLGGDTAAQGWSRSTMQQLGNATEAAMTAHSDDILQRFMHGTPDEQRAAGVQLLEMDGVMGATSPDVQAVINRTFHALGIDRGPGYPALETQLAGIIGGGVTPGQLRGEARPPLPSDRRLKRNIKHLTTVAGNIALYKFQYIWSNQVYVGVMAQDLINTHPEALILGNDGYYLVDYALLGIKMQTIEEWNNMTRSLV